MTTILIKKKDTAGAPAPGDLTNSAGGTEIAVNTATKRIYTKDAAGNVVELGTNGSATTLASLTVTGATALNGTVALGDAAADSITVNGTITSNLIFTDNTYDIGASGATRPRSLFLGTNLTVGGLGAFGSNVAIGSTPTAWTGAYALSVATLTNFGQRSGGNADLVMSWNGKWSGGTSGTGYTYLATGDVASSYEQNGSHRFYTATSGTAGGTIPMLERFAVQNSGIVQSYVNTIVGVVASGGMSAQTGLTVVGGVDVNDNSPGVLTLGSHGNARTVASQIGKIDFYSNDASGGASGVQASIRGVTLGSLGESAGLYFYTGTASSLNLAGAINDAQQWILGGSGSPDSNAKLTLYTSSSATGLSIYELSTGNNARLRLSQGAAAVYYDATYSSGGNSHNFQIGSGTAFSVNSSVAVLGSSSPLGVFGGSALQGPSFLINQVAGVDQTAYVTGAYQATYTGSWLARGAYRASMYQQVSGGHGFFTNATTPAGSGSTVGFTEALTITSLARVGINQPNPTTYLEIAGSGEMIRLDGSPGTSKSIYFRNVGAGNSTLLTDGTWNLETNSTYPINFRTQSANRVQITSGGDMLQLTGRTSTAYGSAANVQEWAGTVGSIANGASFSLFAINGQYDMLCYDLNIFANTGGFFSYKSAGIFGYNGFTNTVLGASITLTITRTGTLYNETMTITNNSSATVNEWVISLRVWGYSARNNVNTGGQDMVTSSYLVRQN